MTFASRLTVVLTIFLALTGTVAAAPALTPEQSVAARRMVVMNGSHRSVHYRVDDLDPLEALAYRRLEYLENGMEMNGDVQTLARLQVQNDTRAELLMAPAMSVYAGANFAGRLGRRAFLTSGYTCAGAPGQAVQAAQTFADLQQAYMEVLVIEGGRLGLRPMEPPPPPKPAEGGAALAKPPQVRDAINAALASVVAPEPLAQVAPNVVRSGPPVPATPDLPLLAMNGLLAITALAGSLIGAIFLVR
ncbi:hypothetical protein AYO40_04865 [Planctomycetaceae bacterium SCGC AG-212-D15]|nr:hypothetical protein AYO40_04865 [Planctomycetaceae bacterium SCGC AG-212-D15]